MQPRRLCLPPMAETIHSSGARLLLLPTRRLRPKALPLLLSRHHIIPHQEPTMMNHGTKLTKRMTTIAATMKLLRRGIPGRKSLNNCLAVFYPLQGLSLLLPARRRRRRLHWPFPHCLYLQLRHLPFHLRLRHLLHRHHMCHQPQPRPLS